MVAHDEREPGSDLALSADGTWERFDVFAGHPDVSDVTEYLRNQGWYSFLRLGDAEELGIEIEVWASMQGAGYLIDVSGRAGGGSFLKVTTLPQVMDLLAKWAPVVQAMSIARVVTDLGEPEIKQYGFVESVAARAAWAAQDWTPILRKNHEEQEARARQARRDVRRRRDNP
ncbi:hypothetical protein [Actinophytocola xanthii]|uniref:Uncharacterized protein n=1 Tax=Actinophytocola xanthii TaxID=1912961 RepID=A0A1Q8BXS6_9PSEU|nr:hypothetical protein [Actinophytocola xanthii]OLF06917.1 hypothetical protein BU204_35980 [Actinophytocola xanthii]